MVKYAVEFRQTKRGTVRIVWATEAVTKWKHSEEVIEIER